jgi:transcriptional regulator with XRE-family HTH domain
MIPLSKTLLLLRSKSNLEQTALAQDLRITPNYLSLIESAKRTPSMKLLKRYSKRFKVPLGYLIILATEEFGFDMKTGKIKREE